MPWFNRSREGPEALPSTNSSRTSFAEMTIEINNLRIELHNASPKASYVSILRIDADEANRTPNLCMTSRESMSGTSLEWKGSNFPSSSLIIRPSSHLLFRLHGSRKHDPLTSCTSSTMSVAQLVGKIRDNESKCICVLRNSEQQEFATLHLTFAITKCPAFSTPSSSSDSPQTQQGIKTGPKKLGNKRHEFSDTFSYEVGQTLHCFAAFRSHYGDQIPILVCSFLYSTLSVFWRVTDGLGPQRVPGNTASTNETTTPFGHFYPLRDIVLQMNFLLLKITQRPLRLTSDLGIRLLHEILEELCACVATLEAEIERYRAITWVQVMCRDDTAGTYRKHLEQLFFLLFKSTLFLHKSDIYTHVDAYDRGWVVQKLLNFAIEERGLELEEGQRPFTRVLTSPRGEESDKIWGEVHKRMQAETRDWVKRDVYRRVLVKIVQSSDRLPEQLSCKLAIATGPNEEIGRGGFATVYKGHLEDSKRAVAIKRTNDWDRLPVNINTRKTLYLEMVVWSTINHENILSFIGVGQLSQSSGEVISELCLVSQYMEGGTLHSFCRSPTRMTTDSDAELRLNYIKQVVDGMAHLHKEELVHGDLRAVNIFIDPIPKRIKIADFGLSVLAEGHSGNYYSTRNGNIRWIAPELYAPQRYCEPAGANNSMEKPPSPRAEGEMYLARPTLKSDVFMFACVCIEVYTGDPPFHGLSEAVIKGKIYDRTPPRFERPSTIKSDSEVIWQVIQHCSNAIASKRPAFSDIAKLLQTSASGLDQ